MKQIASKKLFPITGFWQMKKHFREDDSSCIIDLCLGYGQPQTAHTAAKITRLKDLAVLFRSVCLTK